jgi:hypothetical protein
MQSRLVKNSTGFISGWKRVALIENAGDQGMTTPDKIGLYGTGTADVPKARADAQKAAEQPPEPQQDQNHNCTRQPKPKILTA